MQLLLLMLCQFTEDPFDLFLSQLRRSSLLCHHTTFFLSNKNFSHPLYKNNNPFMKKSANLFAKDHQNMLRLLSLPVILLCSILFSTKSYAQLAPVSPPTGGFRIDGGLKANTPTAHEGDWVFGAGGTGDSVISYNGIPFNSTTTKFIRDSFNSNADMIFSG